MSRNSRAHLVGSYGLPSLALLLFVFFSVVLTATFPTMTNLNAILSNNAIPALLALGAMIPIATGKFDLSIGYGLGLAHVLAMKLITGGMSWPLACLLVIAAMIAVGVLNGVLVEFGRIDSFVATLGAGTVLYAITGAITDGSRIVPTSPLPGAFTDIYNSKLAGIPVPAWYVLGVVALLWVLLERLPLGRYFYVIGSNERAANLIGVPTKRYSIYAFAISAAVTGFAGVLLAAQQQIGNPSVGMDYLLPAFVGALLGSTAIKPGRANAIGTIVAVVTLAIGLAGINQMGADFWVTPLFNGVTLLIAVGLAGYSARKKLAVGAAASTAAAASTPPATGQSRTPTDSSVSGTEPASEQPSEEERRQPPVTAGS